MNAVGPLVGSQAAVLSSHTVDGGEPLLLVRELRVTLQRVTILRGVDLRVPAGEIVALVGRNGAGKTTTLRAVLGLIRVESGVIRFAGEDLVPIPAHRRARLGIGYAPEDRRLVPGLSVEENLLVPAVASGMSEPRRRLELVYDYVPGVADFARRPATQLSGGQQKLVALARALMTGTRLLLLDEPFEGLAPALAERIGAALLAASRSGVAVLVAESEPRHVRHITNHIEIIERGRTDPGGSALLGAATAVMGFRSEGPPGTPADAAEPAEPRPDGDPQGRRDVRKE